MRVAVLSLFTLSGCLFVSDQDQEEREQRCDELAADPARLRDYIAERAIG